jgi:hypothetical protein
MPHKIKCPSRGGARPGSGRPKLDRRNVSARVNAPIYAALAKSAKARKIKLGRLIEDILERAVQPDFAAFFAKHPPVADDGEVLRGLLKEREDSLRG